MAHVRNISGEALVVPDLGRVVTPDELVEVPDEALAGYVCQPSTWADESAPEPAKSAAKSKPKES